MLIFTFETTAEKVSMEIMFYLLECPKLSALKLFIA